MTPETRKAIEQYIKDFGSRARLGGQWDYIGTDWKGTNDLLAASWLRECLDEIERLRKAHRKITRVPIAPGNIHVMVKIAEAALTESQERGDE